MKWHIPAKTFLLGEYAVLAGAPGIILSTKPYFEVSLTQTPSLEGIHPNSPAGILWAKHPILERGLSWFDPYAGRGGLGASSAQFLGCYLALCHLKQTIPNTQDMLKAYFESSWSGLGLKPSGYDVLAQSQQGCVYINQENKKLLTHPWPFSDLSFCLIHTGIKLATHDHLKETTLPANIGQLSRIVDNAWDAFEREDAQLLIDSVNQYQKQLIELDRVATHTLQLIDKLGTYPEILAIKGCGAMGADIILIITRSADAAQLFNTLHNEQYLILATEKDISCEKALIA